jgi:hypothetical protein
LQLSDGTTYEQLVSDLTQALSIANRDLLADPLIGSLISITEEAAVEYPVGVSNGFQAWTEYGKPDSGRGKTTGHMLPLTAQWRGLAWTWGYLQKARQIQLDQDVAGAVTDLKNLWKKSVLQRLFKSTYEAVGSSGRSMPVADGGTADSSYVPVHNPDRASVFAYTHTHLLRMDGITQANLETAIAHLWEHGHDAPYDLLAAQADIGDWENTTNVTGFVKKADVLIRYGTSTTLSDLADQYLGTIETKYGAARLQATARIPTKYWGVIKSYGNLDQRNPLRVRVNPKYGPNAILLAGDHIRQYPLEEALIYLEFGVGIGEDRVNAAIVYNHDDNAYVDPTIS